MNGDAPPFALTRLDLVEKLSESDIPACCGCAYYWEDPAANPRTFGHCRRWPPGATGEEVKPYDAVSVDYDWVCGEFAKGVHARVRVQRQIWRQQLETPDAGA